MKNLIYFTIVAISTFGCHAIPKDYKILNSKKLTHSLDFNCNELFDEIVEEWAIYQNETKEGNCYYYNRSLFSMILENRECFTGMKVSDIQKLFGKPSKISGQNFFYLASKECKYEYDYINDKYYHLRFTAIDTIGDIDFYQIVTDY